MFRHLEELKLSYFEHMNFSVKLSYHFALGSVCAFIHTIYPDILITHSTDTINYLKEELDNMRAKRKTI
jgi:hypothetical protein